MEAVERPARGLDRTLPRRSCCGHATPPGPKIRGPLFGGQGVVCAGDAPWELCCIIILRICAIIMPPPLIMPEMCWLMSHHGVRAVIHDLRGEPFVNGSNEMRI